MKKIKCHMCNEKFNSQQDQIVCCDFPYHKNCLPKHKKLMTHNRFPGDRP